MNKQKLLVFSDCYIYGGSERLMSFLVKNEVLNQKYDIKFAFRNHKIYKEGMAKDFNRQQIKLIPLTLLANDTIFFKINSAFNHKIVGNLLKIPLLILRKIGCYSLYNAFVFLKLLAKQKPDVLHINNGGYPAAASCNLLVFIAKIKGIKRIVYQVNNQAQKSNFLNKFRDKKLSQNVSQFITASNMARTNLSNNVGVPLNKINIIRNIVQLNPIQLQKIELLKEFMLNEDTFVMVNVAFLTKRKGQIHLLKAIKKWIESSEVKLDFCLFLIGDGEDLNSLVEFCAQNNLNDYVHFLGYQSNYADYIYAADLVVFPSISNEDLPLVIIESLMLGKCILATSLAGISEVIVNNENGFLVSPDINSIEDELFKKINYLYSHSDEIDKLGKAAKISSATFSEEIYGASLNKLYQKC